MQLIKNITTIILVISTTISLSAQLITKTNYKADNIDSISIKNNKPPSIQKEKFPLTGMIIPTAMVTYGIIALHSTSLQNINEDIKQNVWTNKPHKQLHMDTYLMFVPGATAFALEAFGVKGKYNLRDKAMIYLMSNIFVNGTVYPLKKGSHSIRPDGSNFNSFPSGHTAEVFASAEFLRKEYKNVSIWYGVAGYAVATATGYLRMYNNKHWFSDVVAGAGIGIASTKLAYWIYPKIQHWIFKDKPVNTAIMPVYNNGSFGISMIHDFK